VLPLQLANLPLEVGPLLETILEPPFKLEKPVDARELIYLGLKGLQLSPGELYLSLSVFELFLLDADLMLHLGLSRCLVLVESVEDRLLDLP
jgi:hypothetical protein